MLLGQQTVDSEIAAALDLDNAAAVLYNLHQYRMAEKERSEISERDNGEEYPAASKANRKADMALIGEMMKQSGITHF